MKGIYETLKQALKQEVDRHHLSGKKLEVRCKALSAVEAIGNPDHDDYPIIKGKEVMVEAVFEDAKGQAFTDAFENADLVVDDLLTMDVSTNSRRAMFISGLNAVFRHLGLCDKTVHCKDQEPLTCAGEVAKNMGDVEKILLVGHQPRFLEALSKAYSVRAVDLDQGNIGKAFSGVVIEPTENTGDALAWCDMIFATGSTIVNGSMDTFILPDKPTLFYGVSIAAPAKILNLNTYCLCGK